MSLFDAIRYRWRGIWRRGDVDRDLVDELRHYADLDAQHRSRVGDDDDTAQWAARRAIGNVPYLQEELRGMSSFGTLIDQARQDARHASRFFRNSPTFAIVDAAMLRPLPFDAPAQLVKLVDTRNGIVAGSPSPLDVRDIARDTRALAHVVAYDEWRKNVSLGGTNAAPEQMIVGLVSHEYFETLGVRPIIGRLFTDAEMQRGSHYVAAISRQLWHDRLADDPHVLGTAIRINDEPYTIVAVMHDVALAWLNTRGLDTRVWTPWAHADSERTDASRGATGNNAIGRLGPHVTIAQARAELLQLGARLAATYPADRPYGLTVLPLAESRAGPLEPIVAILGRGVVLVLIIACTNLAGLLHARNAARQRELLVRTALGASRGRLMRQLLVETLLIAGAGGVCGFLLGVVGCAVVARWHPPQFPQLAGLSIDGTVLLFALGTSVVGAAMFGVWPAWTTARVDVAAELRAGGRTGTATRRQRRVRSSLVVIQIALAVMLVAATAILTQSVVHLRQQDLGFVVDELFKAHVYVPPARYSDSTALTRFSNDFGASVRQLPGVRAATVVTGYLPAAARWLQPITIDGQAPARADDRQLAYLATADEWYVRAYGTSIVRGRDLSAIDVEGGPAVALVNETFAKMLMPGREVVGARLRLGNPLYRVSSPRVITVVGVFRDMKNDGLARPPFPQVVGLYRQLPEFNSEFKDIVARSSGDPALLFGPVRGVLRAIDPRLPLAELATMKEVVAAASGGTTYTTVLLGAFAALGLLLAAIGIYGVVAYMVAQRTAEIGIRAALGAGPAEIVKLVVGSGGVLALIGSAIGLVGSAAARDVIGGQVYGVSSVDPLTLVATAVGLVVVSAVASAVPTWRALQIDPIDALRRE